MVWKIFFNDSHPWGIDKIFTAFNPWVRLSDKNSSNIILWVNFHIFQSIFNTKIANRLGFDIDKPKESIFFVLYSTINDENDL